MDRSTSTRVRGAKCLYTFLWSGSLAQAITASALKAVLFKMPDIDLAYKKR